MRRTPSNPQRKSIFITGATAGIGKSTARLFASKGWYVGLAARDENKLAALRNVLGERNCSVHAMDVADPEQVREQLAAFGQTANGRLNILLNNAGVLNAGHFEDITLQHHHQMVDTNIKGVLNCTHFAFELLKNTPRAQVINMSSASAMYGSPTLSTYSASKFAVRALTEALNVEWARHDITVTDIMPPFVATDMLETSVRQKVKAISRLGVQLTPDEIAQTVWEAVENPKLHDRVTLSFKMLALMQKHAPEPFQRHVVKFLSGY